MSRDNYFFKMDARRFLLSRKVDKLPLDMQAILVRLWCLHCIDGTLENNVEELARRTLVPVLHMQKFMQMHMQTFFVLHDANWISIRMQNDLGEEEGLSEKRSKAAHARWDKEKKGVNANADASAYANCNASADAIRSKKLEKESREHRAELSNFSHILADETDLRGAQHERIYFEILDAVCKREGKTAEAAARWLLDQIKQRKDTKKPLAFWLKDGDWNQKKPAAPKMVNPLDLLREQLGDRYPTTGQA